MFVEVTMTGIGGGFEFSVILESYISVVLVFLKFLLFYSLDDFAHLSFIKEKCF